MENLNNPEENLNHNIEVNLNAFVEYPALMKSVDNQNLLDCVRIVSVSPDSMDYIQDERLKELVGSIHQGVELNLEDFFPKVKFWDVRMENISIIEDSDFIIQRILNRFMHNLETLNTLEMLYPLRLIRQIAMDSSQIFGNELIEYLADRYLLDPKDFKKYIPNIEDYS